MLSQLILTNFQRHKKLKIKLAAVTTIVGRTDAGKSAIIRALRWVSRNRPAGSSFIRHGAKKASTTIRIRTSPSSTQKITRTRTKSKNTYSIDGKPLKAFGSDVPAPVAEVLKITDDNFQLQHDAPFWISLSPGQLSRALNEVVDLESIDHSLAWLNRELRDAAAEIKVVEERLKDASDEKERLSSVVELDRRLREAERAERESAELWTAVHHLQETLSHARRTLRARNATQISARGIETILGAADATWRSVTESRESVERLTELIDRWKREQMSIGVLELSLDDVETELSQYKECEVCGRMMSSPS